MILDVAIADSWWVALLRWVTIFVGGAMVGLAPVVLMTRRRHGEHYGRRRLAGITAFLAAGLFAVLQETDQLGKPMLWWRLPLLLLIVLTGSYVIFGPDDKR